MRTILATLVVALSLISGCGVTGNIKVAILDFTYKDGPNEDTHDIDAVQTAACPGSGEPETFTGAFLRVSLNPRFYQAEGQAPGDVVSYVHLQTFTVFFTPVNADTAAAIPEVTRNIGVDLEMNSKPVQELLFMSLEQKIAWEQAQLDFGDTLPREYLIKVVIKAVDEAGRALSITDFPAIEDTIQIGNFNNC